MYCDLWTQYIQVWKLFEGGNYSRADTIRGNTVRNTLFYVVILFIKKHQQVWKFKIEWISPVLTLRKVKETIIRKILLSVFSFRLKLALKLRTFTNFSRAEFFLDFWSAVICYTVRQVCSVCLLDITIDQNQLEKWVNILSFIFPWTR